MTTCQTFFPRRPVASQLGSAGLVVAVLTLLTATVAPAQSVQPKRGVGTRSPAVAQRPSQPTASASPVRTTRRISDPARQAEPTAGVVRADGVSGVRDGGVVQAGASVVTAECRQCGRRGCNECRADGGRLGLHCNGRCDAGGCPAHCPVRPDQFGYYQTRWRNWPGQGVRQVSHFDPATTPVVPPRSQIPTLEEESGVGPEGTSADLDDDEDEPQPEAARDDAGNDATTEAGDAAAMEPSSDATPVEPLPADDDRADAAEAQEDMPLERRPRSPAADESSRSAPTTLRGDTPTAFRPANPLRRNGFPGVPASGTTGAELSPRPAASASPEASRREGSTSQWRPSRRGGTGEGGDTPLMRGVTANPGNPLR